MAINERLIHTAADAAAGGGTGNQEEGLILHLDANDVDSYDGDGDIWYDITNYEYTPAVDPAENFNTVLYTGNGSTNSITGVGFQPDLVWVKNRTNANSHNLIDSLRGATKVLFSNLNNIESTRANSLTSFNSDGFSLGSYVGVNGSNYNYVAWCFKAGGAPTATNTATSGAMTANSVSIDGELQSAYTPSGSPSDYANKLSVNTKLAFSIIETGTYGSTAESFSHGLGVKPEMVIAKSINDSQDWYVWVEGFNQNEYLSLNDSDAKSTISGLWGSSAPHDSNLIDWHGSSGYEYILYSFASKRGVSKVGSYTGTGAAGNKIYTGFQPAWVMIKNTSSTDGWVMWDNQRGGNKSLFPHDSFNEVTNTYDIDFNGDGFTIQSTNTAENGNGNKIIYLAFATEKPDSLVDDTDLELHLDAGDDTTVSASTWSDKANSNNGTLTNFSSTLDDFYDEELGNWITFDGSDDVVTIPHSSGIDIGSSGFTAELWVYNEKTSGTSSIISNTHSSLTGYTLRINNGTNVQLFIYNNTTATFSGTASSSVSANTWNHLLFTVASNSSGAAVKLYINGELSSVDGTNSASYGGSGNTVELGRYPFAPSNRFLDGRIGQVRIYSSALTADEVMQNYRFTKNDYPNGNNGTFSGLTSSDWNSNGFFDFPVGSDNISLDSFGGIDFNQTLVMWVNLGQKTNADSGTYRYYLYSQYTGSNYQYFNVYAFDESDGVKLKLYWRDTSSSYYFTESDVDSVWSSGWNMVAVYIAGTEEVYTSVNGNNWSETTLEFGDLGTEDVIPRGNVLLSNVRGNTSVTNQRNPFSMSQLKVYDKVLTNSELSALNTAGYQG